MGAIKHKMRVGRRGRLLRVPAPAMGAPIDLGRLIDGVLAGLAATAETRAVRLALELDAPAWVRVPWMALERAFANLVVNAIEHGPAGGEVRVRVGGAGREVVVDVSDEGGGIAPALRERVFEPLFSTRPEKSGLGLTVARAALASGGGHVEIVDGARSVVRARLPRSARGLH